MVEFDGPAAEVDRVEPNSTLVSGVLIVRNEADEIAECLASAGPIADQLVVYDTGSTDGTPDLARTAGASVLDGFWDDDFGRARTAAAAAAVGDWVLVLDADERLRVQPAAVRALLSANRGRPAFTVMIENDGPEGEGGGYAHWASRVARRVGTRWAGRVHEQPVDAADRPLPAITMPGHLLSIRHRGYADPEQLRRKAERNALLAQQDLDRLAAAARPDPLDVAVALLNLGRSLVGAGRRQDAVNTFEALRELAPGTRAWREATDFLARLLLGAGQDEAVLVLSDQLRAAGADPRYCDWLQAQAMAQLGSPVPALELLRGVDELIDPGGRRCDLGQVLEVRALLAGLLGHRDEAVGALAAAMSCHGRVRGRGAMLLDLWGDRPAGGLADVVRRAGSGHLPAVRRELQDAGGRGAAVAAELS